MEAFLMYIQKILYDVSCNLSTDSDSQFSYSQNHSLFDITKNYVYIVPNHEILSNENIIEKIEE